jgi:hypothetical protein
MHGVGTGRARRLDDPVAEEVALRGRGAADRQRAVRERHVQGCRIGFRMHGDRLEAEAAAGAQDAAGDLAAVGDQDAFHRRAGMSLVLKSTMSAPA